MRLLPWLGALLLAVWAILWLGIKIVSGLVHLVAVVAVAMIVVGLVRRGARAVQRRD